MRATERLPSLDVAKGLAILGVIAIHSELFASSAFHTHVVNRSVPMFLVLFGITSAMWWSAAREPGRLIAWYRSRFARLAPPYFAAVILWWCVQLVLARQPLGIDVLVSALATYAPWIQTSWFVAVIVQLILLYPLLAVAADKLGAGASMLAGLGIMIAAQANALVLNHQMHSLLPYPEVAVGFYPFWLFVPQYLWLVLCGMQMTALARAPSARAVLVAFGVFVLAGLLEPFLPPPSTPLRVAATIADPARTVLLLAASLVILRLAPLGGALAWLGKRSWEIYVGQMAVHSLAYRAWERAGGPAEHRVEYTLLLLAGGVGFAYAVSKVRASR